MTSLKNDRLDICYFKVITPTLLIGITTFLAVQSGKRPSKVWSMTLNFPLCCIFSLFTKVESKKKILGESTPGIPHLVFVSFKTCSLGAAKRESSQEWMQEELAAHWGTEPWTSPTLLQEPSLGTAALSMWNRGQSLSNEEIQALFNSRHYC